MNIESLAVAVLSLGARADSVFEPGRAPLEAAEGTFLRPHHVLSAVKGLSNPGAMTTGPGFFAPPRAYEVDFFLRALAEPEDGAVEPAGGDDANEAVASDSSELAAPESTGCRIKLFDHFFAEQGDGFQLNYGWNVHCDTKHTFRYRACFERYRYPVGWYTEHCNAIWEKTVPGFSGSVSEGFRSPTVSSGTYRGRLDLLKPGTSSAYASYRTGSLQVN